MAVERLLEERIKKIGDLGQEEVMPVGNALGLYRQLKKTEFYKPDTRQWIVYMDREQIVEYQDIVAGNQLLGVIVEGLFDMQSANECFTNLKKTELYNKESDVWQGCLIDGQDWEPTDDDLRNHFLGILTEGMFDREKAYRNYEQLKMAGYLDTDLDQWQIGRPEEYLVEGDNRTAEHQLLGILVESMFNKTRAKAVYEKLKQTELYDSDLELWQEEMKANQTVEWDTRYARDQLLGVLVEGMFDMRKGREMYEKIKESKLYDSRLKQWQ